MVTGSDFASRNQKSCTDHVGGTTILLLGSSNRGNCEGSLAHILGSGWGIPTGRLGTADIEVSLAPLTPGLIKATTQIAQGLVGTGLMGP